MNDKRFIELLNLYVDQELTDEEARALEQEIAQRPDRRQVYTQYCRMQRACVRLFEQHAAPAPQVERLTAAAVAGAPEVIELPALRFDEPQAAAPRRWTQAVWAGGMFAAAACVALVAVVAFRQNQAPNAVPAMATAPQVEQAAATVAAAPARASASQGADYQPVVMVNTLLRSDSQNAGKPAANLAALDPQSLDWLQDMKLLPMSRVPFETLRFDSQGRLEAVNHATFASDRIEPATATEISAFQFQR